MVASESDALRKEVKKFLVDWFTAVKRHDRHWLDSHLGAEYVNWIVPEGRRLTRSEYIDVAMAMTRFDAEFVELRVDGTADFIVALYDIIRLRQLPDPAGVDNSTRAAMINAGVYGHDHAERNERNSTVYNTVLRRGVTGEFQVVHHVFLGFAPEVAGDA